jgi:hypothetical protein
MFPTDKDEKEARERLEHPHGEEFPGQYDAERRLLKERNPEEDIDKKYGKTRRSAFGLD